MFTLHRKFNLYLRKCSLFLTHLQCYLCLQNYLETGIKKTLIFIIVILLFLTCIAVWAICIKCAFTATEYGLSFCEMDWLTVFGSNKEDYTMLMFLITIYKEYINPNTNLISFKSPCRNNRNRSTSLKPRLLLLKWANPPFNSNLIMKMVYCSFASKQATQGQGTYNMHK